MPFYSFWPGVNSGTLEIILVFEVEPGWPRGWCFGFQVHRLCRQQPILPTRGWEASDPAAGQSTAITEPGTIPTNSELPGSDRSGCCCRRLQWRGELLLPTEIGGGEGLASRSGQRLWPQPGVWVRLEAADRIEFACHSSGFGHRHRGLFSHFESAWSFCLSFPVAQCFLHWPSPAIAIACALYFAVFALN